MCLQCPYKPCGGNENCKGCTEDPQHSTMTADEFYELNILGCGDCKFCNPKADMEGVESTCKRIDHKRIQFYHPWFKSYDCGQHTHCICADFEPNEWELWLHRHWKPEFISMYEPSGNCGFFLNGDKEVMYEVDAVDFFYDKFKNADGTLKWKRKMYYRRSRTSAIGYKLIREYPDGTIATHN